MSLDADELEQLAGLLRRLAASGGAMPSTPRVIWDALAGVVPRLAIELFVRRDDGAVLLTWRDDPQWRGWHVPGGFVGAGESLGDAARRIATRELGVELVLERVVDNYAWPDHPCGAVLSLLCACRCEETPKDGEYFLQLPSPMVDHHAHFVSRFRAMVGAGPVQ